VAVQAGGGPFTAWGSVFERTSDRIRDRFEPRFPHVTPHRARHTFAMRTLEYLVSGYYRQAAALVAATSDGTGPDAALALYLAKADPLLVLRDLLGHSSVLTTEKYLRRLDTTRIFADAYERAGGDAGTVRTAQAGTEADQEFPRAAGKVR
jgi:integrase